MKDKLKEEAGDRTLYPNQNWTKLKGKQKYEDECPKCGQFCEVCECDEE